MKYYSIAFPGEYGQHVEEIWSEDQIIKSYYTYWSGMMIQNVAAPDLNPKTCIEDWCAVHWAVEVSKPNWITEQDQVGRLEDAEEFDRKRNYQYLNDIVSNQG